MRYRVGLIGITVNGKFVEGKTTEVGTTDMTRAVGIAAEEIKKLEEAKGELVSLNVSVVRKEVR